MDKYLQQFNKLTDNKYTYLRVNSVNVSINDKIIDIILLIPQEIYDFNFTIEDKDSIKDASAKIIPYPFKFRIDYKKSYADKTFILNDILDYINRKTPSLNDVIKESNLNISIDEDVIIIKITIEKTAYIFYNHSGTEEKLKRYLSHKYCNHIKFIYNKIEDTPVDEDNLIRDNGIKEKSISDNHFINVSNIIKLIGKDISQRPMYIRDIKEEQDRVAISGRIKGLYKNVKKGTDKIYYVMNIDDTTGTMRALYFPRLWKNGNEQKALKDFQRKIETMDMVVNDSSLGDYTVMIEGRVNRSNMNDDLNIFISKMSKCDIDFDSIISSVTKKQVPDKYAVIEPQPFIDTLKSVSKVVPTYLKNNRIVVFDFETTGINPEVDTPIELGAVSIVNGRIEEQMSTFINPKREISEEITRITHISNTDVINAPYFEDIIPDFYKFCNNAILVAHNAEFDYAFLKNYAHPLGYIFDNERQDTLAMSRKVFNNLERHSLEALCSHLDITNEGAHRAIYDAIATARLYMILISKYS